MGNYGSTGWDGLTTTNSNINTHIANYAITYLNTYCFQNNITEYNLWKAITCHEIGHALGLDHYVLAPGETEEDSIMKAYTYQYYDVNGTTHITSPCSPDTIAMNAKY